MALRAGTARRGASYEGVLREGGKVAWRCGHVHRNRDSSSWSHRSARDCALAELRSRTLVPADIWGEDRYGMPVRTAVASGSPAQIVRDLCRDGWSRAVVVRGGAEVGGIGRDKCWWTEG